MESDPHDDEGEYYGEPYGSRSSRFDWFWFAVTWLTVPLFIAYVAWRLFW
jgi:hypothetical protein